MRPRVGALLGSAAFFCVAPATVAGWVPWALTRWRVQPPLFGVSQGRGLGAVLIAAGVAIVAECFLRFAIVGLGTPAPVAPTRSLVVSGLYRYVRNPMYVGVLATLVGQALLFGSLGLLVYASLVWAMFHAFACLYEEPTLRRRYGPSYLTYCAHVRRWWPRRTSWSA